MLIDGVDTEPLGLVVEDVNGLLSSVSYEARAETFPLRDDAMFVTRGNAQPRRITVRGTLVKADRATMLANRNTILLLLRNGLVDITFPNLVTQFYRGYVTAVDADSIPPAFSQRAVKLTFQLLCAFPFAIESTNTAEAVATFNTQVATGTGPSYPVIEIWGPVTSPTLVYSNYAGVERARLDFTGKVLTGGQKLTVDCYRQTIVDQAGLNAYPALVSATSRWFKFDPYDAAGTAGPWPQLKILAGTATATYRKTWT
jgi:hypothetical protein